MVVNLNIPQSWNELTRQQLKNIVYELKCFQSLVKDSPEFLAVNSAKLYFQISKELLRNNPWRSIRIALKEVQPKAYQALSKFIYKEINRTKFIPYVKINQTTYYAPDTRLRNSTIGEFAYADAAYYNWRNTQKTFG